MIYVVFEVQSYPLDSRAACGDASGQLTQVVDLLLVTIAR